MKVIFISLQTDISGYDLLDSICEKVKGKFNITLDMINIHHRKDRWIVLSSVISDGEYESLRFNKYSGGFNLTFAGTDDSESSIYTPFVIFKSAYPPPPYTHVDLADIYNNHPHHKYID